MFRSSRWRRVLGSSTTCVLTAAVLPASALASGEVKLSPDPSKLPGGSALEKLVNGAAGMLLIVCLLGVVVGAGIWALSHHSGNPQHASRARSGVLVAVVCALLITAAPALINFASDLGNTVK